MKNARGLTLRLGYKNIADEDAPHELFLTIRQVTKTRNAINNMSVDIKLSKKQIKALIQSGGFLGSLLGKLAGPLMKVAVPLAKVVLAPLGLTAAMSAIDGSIQKKMLGCGMNTTLIISNDDLNDIMQIIQALEDSVILLKGLTRSVATQTKEQKGGFLSMLLGTLGASLLGNLLSGRGLGEQKTQAKGMLRAGEGILRAGEGVRTNFEINDYYKNEPKFNGVFSRNNLPKTLRKGAYVINLDEYDDIGTHWIALYYDKNAVVYFDNFGVEHIPDEIMKFIKNYDIIINIFRIQAYDSIMCAYFCIGFIDYMIKGKDLVDYTNLFFPSNFDKNDPIILRYFKA